MTIYTGKCNCKNITFTFETELEPSDFIAYRCNDEKLTKYMANMLADPSSMVKIQVKERRELDLKCDELETSEYITCTNCKSFIGSITIIDKERFAEVNLDMFDLKDLFTRRGYKNYNPDDDYEQRLNHKRKNWTPATFNFDIPYDKIDIIN